MGGAFRCRSESEQLFFSGVLLMGQLAFREVDCDNWTDFADIFDGRGGPKSCWCMVWRASSAEAKKPDGASRREQMKSRVQADVPVGILGYIDDKPVAWCSIAPRDTYRKLGGYHGDSATERVWSLVCFFIKRNHRGQRLITQLIDAAVAHARVRGATIVEAYPVDPDSPSYRFMGFVNAFATAGFREVGTAGRRRHVMRLSVRDPIELNDRYQP